MITEKAKQRGRILSFWEKHGLQATIDAFPVKRRTLFEWKKRLKQGNSLTILNDASRAPKKKRKRIWSPLIIEELKRLRWKYPNLGKEKLHPLLKEFCEGESLSCPQPRTIGRLIRDCGGLRKCPQKISHFGKIKKINRTKVLRKPKDFKAEYPGHCVALDTVEKHIQGRRRYIITFEDIYTRFGFALATTSHASLAAKEFFDYCRKVFPFEFVYVLTDNGSEFKKHFSEALKQLHLTHYHTYPKTPKMNAHVERFNRTIQEEFADYRNHLLLNHISRFNQELMEWLVWYNTKRVHHAFKNKYSPVQFMLSLEQNPPKGLKKCKSGWPHTVACRKSLPCVVCH
jgi:transposase InsO family protein